MKKLHLDCPLFYDAIYHFPHLLSNPYEIHLFFVKILFCPLFSYMFPNHLQNYALDNPE